MLMCGTGVLTRVCSSGLRGGRDSQMGVDIGGGVFAVGWRCELTEGPRTRQPCFVLRSFDIRSSFLNVEGAAQCAWRS